MRATDFRLDPRDVVLLKEVDTDVLVPVIPKSRYRGSALGGSDRPQTWREMLTQDAHEALMGGHQSAKYMYHALRGQVW